MWIKEVVDSLCYERFRKNFRSDSFHTHLSVCDTSSVEFSGSSNCVVSCSFLAYRIQLDRKVEEYQAITSVDFLDRVLDFESGWNGVVFEH